MESVKSTIKLKDRNAIVLQLTNNGKEDAHFYASNGLPVGVYEAFLELMHSKQIKTTTNKVAL